MWIISIVVLGRCVLSNKVLNNSWRRTKAQNFMVNRLIRRRSNSEFKWKLWFWSVQWIYLWPHQQVLMRQKKMKHDLSQPFFRAFFPLSLSLRFLPQKFGESEKWTSAELNFSFWPAFTWQIWCCTVLVLAFVVSSCKVLQTIHDHLLCEMILLCAY